MDERRSAVFPAGAIGGSATTLTDDPAGPAPTMRGAFRSLADWGFLAHADLPDRPGPAFLLVALRPAPSLRHFDPEIVRFWHADLGRGRIMEITARTSFPFERPFCWGTIQLVDRLAITNEYLTFGGTLSGAVMDGVGILMFVSPVPLLRRGGHSQGWDEAADDLAAFFARLQVALDGRLALEQALLAGAPGALYAAFIADLVDRYHATPALREVHPTRWTLVVTEERRLRRVDPAGWQAGRGLLERLDLDHPRPVARSTMG